MKWVLNILSTLSFLAVLGVFALATASPADAGEPANSGLLGAAVPAMASAFVGALVAFLLNGWFSRKEDRRKHRRQKLEEAADALAATMHWAKQVRKQIETDDRDTILRNPGMKLSFLIDSYFPAQKGIVDELNDAIMRFAFCDAPSPPVSVEEKQKLANAIQQLFELGDRLYAGLYGELQKYK